MQTLSNLERSVILHLAENMGDENWRNELKSQLNNSIVSNRTDKAGGGYYVDFLCSKAPPLTLPPANPLEMDVLSPDGKNRIFFHLYFNDDGLISFMELSSTGDWPEDENLIGINRGSRHSAPP